MDTLDVERLRAGDWHPSPLSEFVLKVHSRCNLACDYCYVYESADQSWTAQPMRMSSRVIRSTASRIAEHAERHALRRVDVILHGGEPLLAGATLIEEVIREVRGAVPEFCRAEFGMQTNGVLLDEKTLDMLAAHEVGVSVSLDGDQAAHDRRRRHGNGRGSHAEVMRGLELLAGHYRALYRGLLCTVDLRNDPVRTYEALLETSPPRVDFLLPHGNWTTPPPGRPVVDDGSTPYADWLIKAFERWYHVKERETGVRYFEEIINLLLGGESRSESIGLAPVTMLVIDTDGALQQVDSLKTSYAGAPETGLTVHDHAFDDVLWHPGVVARQIGVAALSEPCMRCRARDLCGGGAYPHRYREGDGYRNPSVYCPDLFKLIGHIDRTLRRDLAALNAYADARPAD
ncbi:FxsB family radical SAM/SPASM domain protein [Actinomadura spongiicola]|uniref:FxsB family radical SAM/SPASM domain protein n=1 Tax=Actinomadura spongiicola TaxID=2303421 RepID=A0A372GMB0_9ACTN|nr:FxsB family cyclophane-forming radical SAM/SPASM peptide maturase [Actinomadura spongiicola]RFS86500.1 FxsB family radical SAM/SPASM domain protein [Actinomadura spongiicola]